MKFNVIVADPPWGEWKDNLSMSDVKRGAQANYNTMTIEDIKSIPVKSITSDDGALLALWVPSSMLQQGLDVMKVWGFNHKQTYIWVKIKKDPFISINKWVKKNLLKKTQDLYDETSYKEAIISIMDSLKSFNLFSCLNFFLGRLFRQTHEICLIGTTNNKIYKLLRNKSQRSVSFAENLKHSAKPEDLQNSLDIMFPESSVNKIELFARRQRNNWCCVGNESPMTKHEDINISFNKIIKLSFSEYINIMTVCQDPQKLFEMWEKISCD